MVTGERRTFTQRRRLRGCGWSMLPWLVLACGDERPGETTGAGTLATSVSSSTTETSDASSSAADVSSTSAAATSSPGDETAASSATTGGEATTASGSSTGARSSACDDIVGEDFIVPSRCDGPNGNTATEIPANGLYSTSWFGCYFENGEIIQDPGDNCEFACGSQGLCPGQDGPTCEANLKWFAADADRYGCGGRIRVTNCENGNAVVLVTLDRGPNCGSVEMPCGAPVLDMSHDAMIHLFAGETYGGCDLQPVVVEAVDEATPLGPM